MAPRRLMILSLACLACLATALLLLTNFSGCREARATSGLETVTIGDATFQLELAADDPTRLKGLMDRTEIAVDGGMIFVFPDSELRSFWMKDCVVDMDLIFLDPFGRVTALHRMKVQPPRGPQESETQYEWRIHEQACESRFPAQFAIELQAGWLDRLDIEFNDKIQLDTTRLKGLAH